MTAKALVGPVPTIGFYDGTRVAYDVPKDTRDPRFTACRDHHPACDCREADLAEGISELRGELKDIIDAAKRVLEGHPTWVWEDGPNGEREAGCMCTGCQIVRATHILPVSVNGPSARDEVDGLTEWDRECNRRWKSCLDPRKCPGMAVATRNRGHFHDHLCNEDGSPVVPDPDWNEAPW